MSKALGGMILIVLQKDNRKSPSTRGSFLVDVFDFFV